MHLTSLDVSCVRNLFSVSLVPEPGLNIFYGDNGAGKTSVLEAISILSSGKSFRAGKISNIIQTGQSRLLVSARVHNEIRDTQSQLGISRSKDGTEARIDGVDAKRLSELASALPCVVISTSNHELVEGGPSERRSFMDWLLFHVEPDYLSLSRRYKTALTQRNAAIRNGSSDQLIGSWDIELSSVGEIIGQSRAKMLEIFQHHFSNLTQSLDQHIQPTFVYRTGWPDELSLADALKKNIAYCRRVGTTTAGPHRADLKIKVRSSEARYINSRGQQKLLAILMRLAQVDIYIEYHKQPPILLFDDLPSELDKEARKFVFDYLQETGVQVFLTSVDDVSKEIRTVTKKFHVERGEIEKVLY